MSRNTIMESSQLLLLMLGYCLAVIEGELRCYCNESGCVSTGYMCKSSVGQCFTAVEIRGEATHHTHGCLDSLPKQHQSSCRVGVDLISTNKADLATGHLPFLLCCTEHMCNYREDLDISIILTPKYNGTFHRGSAPASEDYAIYSRNQHNSRDDDRDLWFKAAVIAVPIAGGFILVLLVLLAVRMLRSDTRQHRRLIHIHRERSLTRAHVYISDHFSKNHKEQFSLFNENTSNTSAHSCTNHIIVNNKNSRGSSGLCHHSCLSDSSSSFCSNSLHNDSAFRSDLSVRGINPNTHCHTPCSSNYSNNTSHVICSTSSDSQNSASSNTVSPRSFYKDSAKTPCSTSFRLDKGDQVVTHARGQDSHGSHSLTDHRHPSVASWDDGCLKGPAAIV